jgi:tRNA pseudouridine55 synthase
MSGILSVDKPLGVTSFDVVRDVRRGTGVKRVGHAGTLDPMASGVLLVLLGQAVRVSEYLMDLPKSYRATLRLGVSTTTYDAEGEVTAERPVNASEEQLREALAAFEGEIRQVPPAFSAVKVGGERAYKLARKGEAVALRPRRAHVYRIDLISFDPPEAVIEVDCSRGTYVRSLAHDIGETLGCGAHLSGLARTAVGPFTVERAVGEESLRAALADGSWRDLVQPMDCGLLHLPALTLGIEDEKDIRHGRPTTLDAEITAQLGAITDGLEARGYGEDGSLVGILRWDAGEGVWRGRKVFAGEPPAEPGCP